MQTEISEQEIETGFLPATASISDNKLMTPFQTFWMAGFECSDQLNNQGNRVDLLEMTGHLDIIHQDYQRIAALGMKTVREGIRWSVVETAPYQYDFSTVSMMLDAADACGIQQIWDICHFGYPDDLQPLHPHFTPRFVALCEAFVKFYTGRYPGCTLLVTPINEVSFISWLGGVAGATAPFCTNNGWDVKYGLMRAYIAGSRAMKSINPLVKIVTTEPLVNMVPGLNPGVDDIVRAEHENELQFQSVDMLSGRICPELGGSEDLIDILGFNYYYNNQWIVGSSDFLGWNDPIPDPRWKPLSALLEKAYHRYHKPFIISETSHPKEDRPLWIHMIGEECAKLLRQDIPLLGVCLYPIIDRPDWDHLDYWHHAGLWDTDFSSKCSRILHTESAEALRLAQALILSVNQEYKEEAH